MSARRNAAPPSTPSAIAFSVSASTAGLLPLCDHDLSGHLLVSRPAEDVAMKEEGPRLLGNEADAGGLAGLDVDAQAELRDGESVIAIEGSQLEDHRDALLDLDRFRRVGEAPRRQVHDSFRRSGLRLRRQSRRPEGRRIRSPGGKKGETKQDEAHLKPRSRSRSRAAGNRDRAD